MAQMANSYVTFLYDIIRWTSQTEIQAGINDGDRVRAVTLRGSFSNNIRRLLSTSNTEMPGIWMYRVDSLQTSCLLLDSLATTNVM